MIREDMLARLVAQGTEQGGDLVTMRAIIEEASELGSARALKRMGLYGADAENDIHDLRELLRAWRDAKRSALRAVVEWLVRLGFALLLLAIVWRLGGRLGLMELLR